MKKETIEYFGAIEEDLANAEISYKVLYDIIFADNTIKDKTKDKLEPIEDKIDKLFGELMKNLERIKIMITLNKG